MMTHFTNFFFGQRLGGAQYVGVETFPPLILSAAASSRAVAAAAVAAAVAAG
jgi:hypothetical protein